MKKYITLAALLAAGSAFAGAATILTFDQKDYDYDTDKYALNSLGNGPSASWSGSSTLSDDTVATFDITSGKFWDYTPTSTSWTNASVLTEMNAILGSSITDSDINNLLFDATAASGSKSTLSLDFSNNTQINIGDEVVFYLFVATTNNGGNTAAYTGFSVSGLADSTVSWAAQGGDGYDSSITSFDNNVLGLIKVQGKIQTEDAVIFSANSAKNGWAMLAYSVIPEPSAFGLLAGLGALALVGTRRRRR